MTINESILIEKAQKGDKEALGTLLSLHRPKLQSYALKILRNDAYAEDAVSETFLRASAAFPSFQDNGEGAGPWLRKIARNVALEMARQNQYARSKGDGAEITARQKYSPGGKWNHGDGNREGDVRSDRFIAEELRIEWAEHRGKFIGRALGTINGWDGWPDAELKATALQIAVHDRMPDLLDTLTKAGGRINQEAFQVIVLTCAQCAAPQKVITPRKARTIIRKDPGKERLLGPTAMRKVRGPSTLHKYELIPRLEIYFRTWCKKPVPNAVLIAAEITYGRKWSLDDLKKYRKRARKA